MIKLVENNNEASLVLEHLTIDMAPQMASKMFSEGFGVNQDFLQFYAAFSDSGKLCGAFIKCNDRLFCLIEELYDEEEIVYFLGGFQNFKIFINSEFSHIVDRNNYNMCNLMKKKSCGHSVNSDIIEIDSKNFTDIIMKNKDRDSFIRFFLNNSHLTRHGYLKNYALLDENKVLSIASVYNDKNLSYLCNVFTPEIYRHQGKASALINRITNNDFEYHLICSSSLSEFYEKCGFITYSKWIEFLY